MKILRSVTILLGSLGLLPLSVLGGTAVVTSGPNNTPPGAYSLNTITATDPESDQAELAGGATIAEPGGDTASINMSGTFSANAGDLTSVAYTFTVDSNVTGNTTFEINGSANPSTNLDSRSGGGGGGHFSANGTIMPGEHVYTAALPPPGPMQAASSGVFNLTLTFHFNAPTSDDAQSAPVPSDAAPGTLNLTIQGVLLQVAPTAATPPPANVTPTPTPSPTAAPSPTPATALLINLSTRLDVQTGSNVLIGGFIVTGTNPKQVVLRGLGPSVQLNGTGSSVLADPVLQLHEPDGTVVTNDNWMDNSTADQAVLTSHQLAPSNSLESAIVATLSPGTYTAILSGKNNGMGVGLVEVYDIDETSDSQLANLSTRGFVQSGENVMIGGFILGPDSTTSSAVVIRALGPSLTALGVPDALSNPNLELHDGNGNLIASNDDWRDGPDAQTITNDGLAPSNDLESALLLNSGPGTYTAIVSGSSGSSGVAPTGVALVEVYNLR